MKNLAILALAAIAGVAGAQTFTTAGGSIPDNNPAGVSFTFNVTGPVGAFQSLSFTGLSHTWVGDLIVTLSDPNGNTVDVMRRVGSGTLTGVGSSSDLIAANTYSFATGGASIWTAAATNPIASGVYSPSTNLFTGTAGTSYQATSFAGLSGTGTWTLFMSDNAAGDLGTFQQAALTFAPVPEPASMTALGLGALALIRRRRAAKK